MSDAQIRLDLCLEDRMHVLHALDFDDDRILNDEIDAVLTESLPLINRRNANFATVLQACSIEFDAQRSPVH